ncbi:hypothetical protein M6B38_371095 [Iris pallida]|uniref:Uncharacterized protein n=1 Tax=Iris pallida TaxID=29817 RepID=A0AAX6GEF0_IRIPA|nr:hypothetical protein M6B38_371095 [Iris pallida]
MARQLRCSHSFGRKEIEEGMGIITIVVVSTCDSYLHLLLLGYGGGDGGGGDGLNSALC